MCWKKGSITRNSGAKYVCNAGAISKFFSLPRQSVGKKTAEDSIDTFVYYLGNGFGMPRHFAKGYDLVFKQLRLLVLPNCIVYLWNTWMGETKDTISLVDHLVWFWFWFWFWLTSEAVPRTCSMKKLFLEISQNTQENTSASGVFLWILQNF